MTGNIPLARARRRAGIGGFTMIELLIVVTLVIVLAGIGLSTYSTSVVRAKEAVLRENLRGVRDSIDQYYADKGAYPPDLSALVTEGYLRQVPKDPFTDSPDSWQIITPEPDASNPDAMPGVYDIKSGSPGATLDGTPHSEL